MYTQYGVREICDVVFKAKSTMTVGSQKFYKGEPVIYFDTLKTSTLEGAASTVYATGGRGNSRLVAWEGERTVTFTMEDALISPISFAILSGAGLITAGTVNNNKTEVVYQHMTKIVKAEDFKKSTQITLNNDNNQPLNITDDDGATIYILPLKDGKSFTEPFMGRLVYKAQSGSGDNTIYKPDTGKIVVADELANLLGADGKVQKEETDNGQKNIQYYYKAADGSIQKTYNLINNGKNSWTTALEEADAVKIDFYIKHLKGATQIEIAPDSFGGNFYIEASTLFKDTDGKDLAAEFIIPNAKIQSNFNFSMASSGDPSTFTFTCDAFPDYTRFNKTKKVIAALQIISGGADNSDLYRKATKYDSVTPPSEEPKDEEGGEA